jgi:hypothetical protein
MKTLSLILWVLLAASVVVGGVFCTQDLREVRSLSESRAGTREKLRVVRENVTETGIKYRGYLDSLSEIPDSLRMKEAGSIVKRGETYRKQLYQLERDTRELERLNRKKDVAIDAVYSSLKRRLLLFGGAAVVFLAGALMTRRTAIRS